MIEIVGTVVGVGAFLFAVAVFVAAVITALPNGDPWSFS